MYAADGAGDIVKAFRSNGSLIWEKNAAHTNTIQGLSVSPNGKFIYSGGYDEVLQKRFTENGSLVSDSHNVSTGGIRTNSVDAGPNGTYLAFSGEDDTENDDDTEENETFQIRFADNLSVKWEHNVYDGCDISCEESSWTYSIIGPDGKFVYTTKRSNNITRHWVENGSMDWQLTSGHMQSPRNLDISSDGSTLFVTGKNARIEALHTSNGSQKTKTSSFYDDNKNIYGIEYDPVQNWIYVVGQGHYMQLGDSQDLNSLLTFNTSQSTTTKDVAAGSDGQSVYLASTDDYLRKGVNRTTYKSTASYNSTKFNSSEDGYWDNVTVKSELNNGSINITVEISSFFDFSTVNHTRTFELNGGKESFNLDGIRGKHIRFNISLSRSNTTYLRPDIDYVKLYNSSICDSGSLGSTCNISKKKKILDGQHISSDGSIIIRNGGELYNNNNRETFNITANDNITVKNGGKIIGNVNLSAGNLTVESGGVLDASGVGYSAAGGGPGAGEDDSSYGGGAGYGGVGGVAGAGGGSGGSSYGSLVDPLSFGSAGGSGFSSDGTAGGGRLKLNVSDSVVLNGSLIVDGDDADGGAGGGSGGSVWLNASVLSGSGSVSAVGGAGGSSDGAGAGGGRVAFHVDSNGFTGSIGLGGGNGAGGGEDGQSGTVYQPVVCDSGSLDSTCTVSSIHKTSEAEGSGDLVIEDGGSVQYPEHNLSLNFSSVEVRSGGNISSVKDLNLSGIDSLNLSGGHVEAESVIGSDVNLTADSGYGLDVKNSGLNLTDLLSDYSLSNTGEWAKEGYINTSGDSFLTVDDFWLNSTLAAGNRDVWSVDAGNVTVQGSGSINANVNLSAGNLTVESGGVLDASGVGYSAAGGGPGAGEDGSSYGGGAGYGGAGGDSGDGAVGGSSYGSLVDPLSFGSGGGDGSIDDGGAGGGRLKLNVSDSVVLNGSLIVDGDDVGAVGGGGSGGSVWLNASVLSGSGSVSAVGGAGGSSDGAGAGGGRVAFHVDSNGFTGSIGLGGGNGDGDGEDGQSGTVFRCSTVSTVSCSGTDESSSASLSTSYNKSANGTYVVRNITDDWSSGYLNWTENVSLTQDYDSDWIGAINASYNVTGLASDIDFEVLKDGSTIHTENSGSGGNISFFADLTGKHSIEVLEKKKPEWRQQAQNTSLISAQQTVNLSAELKDAESGLNEVRLSTNESGSWQNRSGYTQSFGNPTSYKLADIDWKNTSLEGSVTVVGWKMWFRDATGNWNVTDVKNFEVDGKKPAFNNLSYTDPVDVDDGSTTVKINVTDNNSISQVLIEENSSGSFTNSSMTSGSGDTYTATVSRSSIGDVDFNVFANDTMSNLGVNGSSTINFQNITVTRSLNSTSVNSSETIQVSGNATVDPEGTDVSGNVNVWLDTGDGFENYSVASLSGGSFSQDVSAAVAGTHTLKMNTTNSDGIYGANTTSFNVSLNLKQENATFKSSGTSYLDVNDSDHNITLSAHVSNSTDSDVDTVEATVTDSSGTTKTFSLNNNTWKNSSGTWNRTINITEEFSDTLGRYNVSFNANTTRGIGSNIVDTKFYLKDIDLTQQLNTTTVNESETVKVTGFATLKPDDTAVTSETVDLWLSGMDNGSTTTNSTGGYEKSFTADSSAGFHTVKVNISNQNSIVGENQVQLETLLNLTNQSAISESLSTDYLDANNSNQNVSLSIETVNPSASIPVGMVWANVTAPDGTKKRVFLNNQTNKDTVGVWNGSINVSKEFDSQLGQYNVTFEGNMSDGAPSLKRSDDFQVQNIKITENLNISAVNASEAINVSGTSTLKPNDTDVSSTVNVWLDRGQGFQKLGSNTPSSSFYEFEFSDSFAGTHDLKVNVSNPDSIIGVNTTSFNVSLNITKENATFDSSGTSYLDVNDSDHNITLSADVSNSTDSDIDTVKAVVTDPDGSKKEYSLNNNSLKNSSGTWNRTINITSEFNDTLGQYNVTFNANTTRGIGSNYVETDFYLQNISIEENLDDAWVNLNDTVRVTGKSVLKPDNSSITSRNASLYVDGKFKNSSLTNSTGDYELKFESPGSAGNHTVKVNITDGNSIDGVNSTTLSVFNLSTSILSTSSKSIFKDTNTDTDLDFTDNITSDPANPANLTNVQLRYEVPDNWTKSSAWDIGKLKAGESSSNDPSFDIGQDAKLGTFQINATGSADNGISSTDSINISVWTNSTASYNNIQGGDTVDRSKDNHTIQVNVTDYINDSGLENITAELFVDSELEDTAKSNASGIAELNWTVSDYSAGEHVLDIDTQDATDLYINGTTTSIDESIRVDLLGVIQKQDYSQTEDVVYRKNGTSPESSLLTIDIQNSNGTDIQDADVYAEINGTVLHKKTDSDGIVNPRYNPPDSSIPGNYTIEINASKSNYKTLEFNKSIEVRGNLSISQNGSQTIYTRGLEYDINSTVTDEFGNATSGNVSWKLNGSEVATSEDSTWTPSTSNTPGEYHLSAGTNRSYFDDDTDNQSIELFGIAKISSLKPGDASILPNATVNVTARVIDANTSADVENMPVVFRRNGTKISTELTNSTGHARLEWSPGEGTYNLSASISDNQTINYNVTSPMMTSEVKFDKDIVLDSFSTSESDISRSDSRDPFETTFTVDVSKASDDINTEPATGENISFEINGTEEVTCQVDDSGSCSVTYNPDSVSVGNLSVEITSNKTGWDNFNQTRHQVVKDIFRLTLDNPSGGIVKRNKQRHLNGTTQNGRINDVDVPVNWSFRGTQVATGSDTTWTPSFSLSLGSGELKMTAYGEYYYTKSITKTVDLFGQSSVNLTEPDNSSKIGYGETPKIRCDVLDSVDRGVNNYPVEFTQNGSSLGTSLTDSDGEATLDWDVPDQIDAFEIGCEIKDNETLHYNVTSTSFDSKIYNTKDDVSPTVSNLSTSSSSPDPGDKVNITYQATDQVNLDSGFVDIKDPDGFTSTYDANKDGSTFWYVFDTQSKTEGGYTVTAKANDSSGNVGQSITTFALRPGADLSINDTKADISGVTQSSGRNVSVVLRLKMNETGNSANITGSPTASSKVSLNSTDYSCGDLADDEYCNKTFTVEVLPGTSPGNTFVTFTGEWLDSEDTRGTVDTTLTLDVKQNPVLSEETGNWDDIGIDHGDSSTNTFKANSTGNYRVEDYNAEFIEDNISKDWITLTKDTESKLTVAEEKHTKLNVSVPEGTPPSDLYFGQVNFTSSNGGFVTRDVEINVREDPNYDINNTKKVSAIEGTSGKLTEIEIENTGNVNLTLGSHISGNASSFIDAGSITVDRQKTKTLNVFHGNDTQFPGNNFYNATIKLNTTTDSSTDTAPTLDVPEKSINLDIDIVSFFVGMKNSSTTVDTEPGNYSTVEFNVTLDGQHQTENLSNTIYVNGTEANINSETTSNGIFKVNFTIPEVEDARTHDLKVESEDTNRNIDTSKTLTNKYNIPDITDPTILNVSAEDIDSGENSTLQIDAKDNSLNGDLKGVDNITVNLTDPSGNTSTVYPTAGSSNWSHTFENLTETGDYEVDIEVKDPAGLTSNTTEVFRVGQSFSINDSFEDSSGNSQTADLTFRDPETGKTFEAKSIDGEYNVSLREGKYDLDINFSDNQINMKSITIDQNTSDIIKIEEVDSVDAPSPSADAKVMAIGAKEGVEPDSATITFNYSEYKDNIPSDKNVEDIQLGHCDNYDYENINCDGSFETIDISDSAFDKQQDTVTVDVSGFSIFTLFIASESDDSDSDDNDNNDDNDDSDDSDDSGGGGGGGFTSSDRNLLEGLNNSLSKNESQYVEFGSNTISARLKPGESKKVSVSIANKYNNSQTFEFRSSEVISEYVDTPDQVKIEPRSSRDVVIDVNIPASELPNSYSGSLNVKSEKIDANIPVNINILPPDKKLLDLSVDPVFDSVAPGDTLKVETTFSNQGYTRNVDVTVNLELIDPEKNETVARKQKTLAVGTTLTRVLKIEVPENSPTKRYEIRGTARYTNLDVPMVATAVTPIELSRPFWQREFFNINYSTLGISFLILLIASITGYGIYQYHRKKELEKKRYLEQIDLSTIPTGGKRQAFVGQLAEMGTRTFAELDDLTTHALIAGATGSGKTVTGQAMVEEALKKGVNVIVLDPTAQWSGFLRENQEEGMLKFYDKFGMSQSDARSFPGNIRAIEPEQQDIDITPYLETEGSEGEIVIFSMHKLDSENIDKFANSTIQQVFDANLPERDHLETLIVYDEAHRLLDKFGGSGKGLNQLERGAREFRKWGVGMVLLSQVVSDFPGEVRANVGTTIQMRTQYEGDLERIKEKFGMDTVQSVAKAEVGSGMLQNSDYNHGRPYFVNFRPLLHSPHRLSDDELDKYEEYNQKIDNLKQKIDSLEEQGEEVYEYRSELKLAKKNLRKGSFNLVDIYLDELKDSL